MVIKHFRLSLPRKRTPHPHEIQNGHPELEYSLSLGFLLVIGRTFVSGEG